MKISPLSRYFKSLKKLNDSLKEFLSLTKEISIKLEREDVKTILKLLRLRENLACRIMEFEGRLSRKKSEQTHFAGEENAYKFLEEENKNIIEEILYFELENKNKAFLLRDKVKKELTVFKKGQKIFETYIKSPAIFNKFFDKKV
ncbi:MAG: hypothetical protein SV062_05525 [Thermodesulfobacteriota bacterium]|nr:hypothetical protein [Thermodesulfobacteriota bacterium]